MMDWLIQMLDAAGVIRHYSGALPEDTGRFIELLTEPLAAKK